MIVNVLFLTDSQGKDIGHYMPFRFIEDMYALLKQERKERTFPNGIFATLDRYYNLTISDKKNNKIQISIRYVEPRRIDGDQLVDLLHSGEVTYEQLLEELGLKQEDFNNERLIVVNTCYSGKPMVQYAVGHFMPKAETAYLIHEAFLFRRHGAEKFIKETFIKETAASADYISENVFFKRLELKAARERCDDFCLAGRSLVERFDENADVVRVALATILLTASAMLMTKPGKMELENPTT